MGGVFISYRRDDSQGSTGRLYDRLHQLLPDTPLFVDIDSIRPGQDFRQVITETLDQCDVTLVMIGPRWVDIDDGAGGRRLDDPGDLHRLEVESALASSSTTIPVLVEGARMPGEDELPDSIKPLAFLHAAEVSVRRFSSDTQYLAQMIEAELTPGGAVGDMALGAPPRPVPTETPAEPAPAEPEVVAVPSAPEATTPRWVWGALGLAAAAIVALAIVAFSGGSNDDPAAAETTATATPVPTSAPEEDDVVSTVLLREAPLVVPDVGGLPAGLWREEANLQGVVFEGDTTQITFRAAHYVSTAAAIMRSNPQVALDVAVVTFSTDPDTHTQLAADRAGAMDTYLAGWMGDTSQLSFVAEIEAPPPGRSELDGRVEFRTPGGGPETSALSAAGIGASNLLSLQLNEENFMLGWGNFERGSGAMTEFGESILTNVGQSIAQAGSQNVQVIVWTYNTVAGAEGLAAEREATVRGVLEAAGAGDLVTVEGRVGAPGYANAPVDGQFSLIVEG